MTKDETLFTLWMLTALLTALTTIILASLSTPIQLTTALIGILCFFIIGAHITQDFWNSITPKQYQEVTP